MTQTLDYYPFGSEQINSGSNTTDRHFIGERYDSAEDLNYLNARYYRGAQGQFLSQDPLFLAVGDPRRVKQMTQSDLRAILTDPQALNSYSYARNNPIVRKDPAGEFFGVGSLASQIVISSFIGYGVADLGVGSIDLWWQLTADGNFSPQDGTVLGRAISRDILINGICGPLCDIYKSFSDIATISPRGSIQTSSPSGGGSRFSPPQVIVGSTPWLPPPPPPPPSGPPSSGGGGGGVFIHGFGFVPPPPPPPPAPSFLPPPPPPPPPPLRMR